MWIIQSIFLSISLAMDAFAVSLGNGLADKKMKLNKTLLISFSFGLFQGVMPLIGYLFGSIFESWIEIAIPIIGFIILMFLGINMILDSIKEIKINYEHNKSIEVKEDKTFSLKILLIQSIATSIDALTVGIVYIGSNQIEALTTFALIGIITFIICIAGVIIGKKFGDKLRNKSGIFGGSILCAIAIKILIEFLIDVL